MMDNTGKYERITEVLRRSEPQLPDPVLFEEKVMGMIREKKTHPGFPVLDCLFGWVYIGWIRNVLVTASFLLITVFAFQQSMILKRIGTLEKQVVYPGVLTDNIKASLDNVRNVLCSYPVKGPVTALKIPEKEMKKIFESLNELQSRYRELIILINENPELKKYIEDRLNENERKKFNL